MSEILGYVRVSTSGQDFDMQKDDIFLLPEWKGDLKGFRRDYNRIFADVMSGSSMDRPGWKTMMAYIRDGDTLVLWSLDRMGRSLSEMVVEFENLKKKNVTIKILHGTLAGIDTSTDIGNIFFILCAGLAEMERKAILERTAAGRKRAQERGVIFGRTKKVVDMIVFRAYVNSGLSGPEVRKVMDIGRNKYFKCLKEIREADEKGEEKSFHHHPSHKATGWQAGTEGTEGEK